MPRKSTRAKPRKSARPKRGKSIQAKHRKPVRGTRRPIAQDADQIWKEKVSPQINQDLQTLNENLKILEDAKKQAEDLIGWADRHNKKFEVYVLSAISGLNSQAAYDTNMLKVLLLRLGDIMVDVELSKTRKPEGARPTPPELEVSLNRLQDMLSETSKANKASIEAARKLVLYF
jgi:hypothetical protein